MINRLIESLKNLDRRVKVAIAATGLVNFGTRMTLQYDTRYAVSLGADPVNIGLLSTISSAVSARAK